MFSVNNDTKPLHSLVEAVRVGGVLERSFHVFLV